MIEAIPLKSAPVLYLKCADPATSDDVCDLAEDLARGEYEGFDLHSPLIVDFTFLREAPGSFRHTYSLAHQRRRFQHRVPAGPAACICRDLKDMLAARFYGAVSHMIGLRDENLFHMSLHADESIRALAKDIGLDPDTTRMLAAEVEHLRCGTPKH